MKLCIWCSRALVVFPSFGFIGEPFDVLKCPHCDKPCKVHGQCGYCINASQHMRELDKEINGK